ncbi:MAG: conjugal transfer protein TraD [Holosporales bacterium]|nr:conjugal transfer protein TraD [Holosporales bacterium]
MNRSIQTKRHSRTRLLIQIGGLFQKAGLLETFGINADDDLQEPESLIKAARVLGFFNFCLENYSFEPEQIGGREHVGERLLRYVRNSQSSGPGGN